MKKQIITGIGILSLMICFATASRAAQTLEHRLVVNIPFQFVVGLKTFPAGEYTVKQLNSSTLLIRGKASHQVTTVATFNTETLRAPRASRLVFHRYGDQYFLSQVWTAGELSGQQVQRTTTEEHLAKRGAKQEQVSVTVKK